MKATAEALEAPSTTEEVVCRHHWLLGQPIEGVVPAVCRNCGQRRGYPAVLDDLDPPADPIKPDSPEGVATAVGGARPSSVTSSPVAASAAAAKLQAIPPPARTRRAPTPATGQLRAVPNRAKATTSAGLSRTLSVD
jgi:hypothetical protein